MRLCRFPGALITDKLRYTVAVRPHHGAGVFEQLAATLAFAQLIGERLFRICCHAIRIDRCVGYLEESESVVRLAT